jgi:hypothetical protein
MVSASSVRPLHDVQPATGERERALPLRLHRSDLVERLRDDVVQRHAVQRVHVGRDTDRERLTGRELDP